MDLAFLEEFIKRAIQYKLYLRIFLCFKANKSPHVMVVATSILSYLCDDVFVRSIEWHGIF